MAVYIIAQLKFTDRAAYDRYQAGFASVFAKYNGKVLASDEHPRVLEGTWERDKVVLLSFPDEDSYRMWAELPFYKEIALDRTAGAEAVVLLVRGVYLGAGA